MLAQRFGVLRVLFLRVTFELRQSDIMTKDDIESFASSVMRTTPALRFIALSTGRERKSHIDEWYDDVYGSNRSHTNERWWKVVKDGNEKYLRDMTSEDGEMMWRRFIDEDDFDLDGKQVDAGVDDEAAICECHNARRIGCVLTGKCVKRCFIDCCTVQKLTPTRHNVNQQALL